MGTESQIIHTPDSTGKAVRTLAITTYIDGVATTVQMQVISIVDMDGREVGSDTAETNALLRSMLKEMTALRTAYGLATGMNIVPQ